MAGVKLEMLKVLIPVGTTGLELQLTVSGAGAPVTTNSTGVLKPTKPVTFKLTVAVSPAQTVTLVVLLEKTKVGVGGNWILKLALEMSKNMFPTASTFTRQVLERLSGTVTTVDPELGTLAAKTIG